MIGSSIDADNGSRVAVMVERKAPVDEENDLEWVRELDGQGIRGRRDGRAEDASGQRSSPAHDRSAGRNGQKVIALRLLDDPELISAH